MTHEPIRAMRHVLTAVVFFTLTSAAHGATLYVANNGVDGGGCGAKATPCRSITKGIALAADGDRVIVGPGRYGPDEETVIFGCMVLVYRDITITSSDGAAATVIDARTVSESCNVGIIGAGVEFGRPGQGFTVTNTRKVNGDGIVLNATNIKVRGNQVVATPFSSFPGNGIAPVDATQTILIEGNQVIGWTVGIQVLGAGKTVSKNHVSLNNSGILATGESVVVGNVVTANGTGIDLLPGASSAIVGNAVYGNSDGLQVEPPFGGRIEKNNVFGNGHCGLNNFGVTGLLAAHNYWGAPTGPGPDPADKACIPTGGTTTVTPFATHPFTVNPPIRP